MIHETQGVSDGIKLSQQAALEGAGLMVVIGGDGTINEVVNGLMLAGETCRSICELGIINCGSGGDLARTLALPSRIKEQGSIIFKRPAHNVDLGLVACQGENGLIQKRYFANECSVGISGSVVASMNGSSKTMGARLAFALASVAQIFKYQSKHMQIKLDDQHPVSQQMLGLVVGNGRFAGGGMQLTPGAKIEDGLLDVLCMKNMSIANRLLVFSKVYKGSHIDSKFACYQKASTITVESKGLPWIETDGELIGKTPCEIGIVPGAVKIRY